MALTLMQNKTAIGLGNTASFLGAGGVEPYVYEVVAGGQGGSINSSTGVYSSPVWSQYNPSPSNATDTVKVTDDNGDTATAKILVGPPAILVIDIISKVMDLPSKRCFLYDQKIFAPTDVGLYVAVGVGSTRVFANSYEFNPTTQQYDNFINCAVMLDIHVVSVDNVAFYKKEEVLMALMSPYSIQQQEANAFSIGRIPSGGQFNDLSEVDGPAVPFHYQMSINVQYAMSKSLATDVFDSFQGPTLVTNP